jgi:hypothetical protein
MTVKSKVEARSDLYIWDASQMVVLFNPLRSNFLLLFKIVLLPLLCYVFYCVGKRSTVYFSF